MLPQPGVPQGQRPDFLAESEVQGMGSKGPSMGWMISAREMRSAGRAS